MKKFYLILMALAAFTANAQVRIATDQGAAHSKSMLEINSTDKGLLIPRLTTAQRTAITATADATADGLLVYDTDLKALYVYSGAAWNAIPNTASISSSSTIAPVISSANGANAILGFNVVDGSITAAKLASMSATSGQVLTYNGTAWAPATPAAGGGGGGVDPDVNIIGIASTHPETPVANLAFTTVGSTTLSNAAFDPSQAYGNIAIGENALSDVTTGGNNIAIGINAGLGVSTGSDNIFIGKGSSGSSAVSNLINIGNHFKLRYDPNKSATSVAIGYEVSTPSIPDPVAANRELIVNGEIQANSIYTDGIFVNVPSSSQTGAKRFGYVSIPASGVGANGYKVTLGSGLGFSANSLIIAVSNSDAFTGSIRAVNNHSVEANTFFIKSSNTTDNGRVSFMIIN